MFRREAVNGTSSIGAAPAQVLRADGHVRGLVMNRRHGAFTLLAMAAGVAALPALAQRPHAGRPLRIGLLPDFSPKSDPLLTLFSQALAEFGRVEGRDFVYVRSGVFYGRSTQQALERVMAAQPDLLLIMNLGYAVAARKVTQTLPMVMWVSGFPVEGGVAESLARPGGNVTGLTIYAGGEVFGKLVQLVHEVKPDSRRIGALVSYVPPFHPRAETDLIVRGMRDAAGPLGVDVRIYEIARPEQVDGALASIVQEGVDALVLTSDASMAPRMGEILRFAAARRLPTIVDAHWTELEDPRPLLTYSPSFGLLIRQAAPYVNKILWEGARPGDLPIQLPAQFQFVVNLRTARTIALTVPSSMRLRADKVIE